MSTRAKLEIAGGLITLVILLAFVKMWNDKQVDVRTAEIVASHDQERDAKLSQTLQQIQQSDAARQKDYDLKTGALAKSTPQQIVVKLPEYVPQATQPVQILKPTDAAVTSGQAHSGDAIVPQEDVKPIAQAILDGHKCSEDFASCKQSVGTWEEKYKAKSDESDRWQTAAKGGSVWKRMGKAAIKIGIGVGIGYAVAKR